MMATQHHILTAPPIKPPARARKAFSKSIVPDPAAVTVEAPAALPSRRRGARREKPAVAVARFLYQLRRQRGALFGCDLFSEPAWDILLDLYVAGYDGRRISLCSACIGAAAPQTTGLRWINLLSDLGLVVKKADPRDARRVYVRLAPKAVRKMDALLSGAMQSDGLLANPIDFDAIAPLAAE